MPSAEERQAENSISARRKRKFGRCFSTVRG